MSKTISDELKAHLAQETSTLAKCWRIARTDGQEYFFTDHDVDMVIDGDTYEAASGMVPSDLTQDRGAGPDNMEAVAFLESDKITEADLNAGRFDGATVDIFIVNWADPTQGKLYLCRGWILGEVGVGDNSFSAELLGKAKKLNQSIGPIYSPSCRATLGDDDCGVDVDHDDYTQTGTVDSVTDNQTFIVTGLAPPGGDEDCFRYGLLTWSAPDSEEYDGENAGLEMEVKSYNSDTGEMTLFQAMPYEVTAGDQFEVTFGCDGDINTCHSRFGNSINFRAEPFVPQSGSIPMTAWQPRGTRGLWTRRGR